MNTYLRSLVIALLMVGLTGSVAAQKLDYKPSILMVTAHPDDDALFSATIFKTTHLLDGEADLAVLTNGEGDIGIPRLEIMKTTPFNSPFAKGDFWEGAFS